MNDTADLVSKQIDLIKQEIELAELQANGRPYSSRNLPIESVHKYGRDFIDVRDEDRDEIEGALGIIDRSECLICELQTSATQLACEPVGLSQERQPPTGALAPACSWHSENYQTITANGIRLHASRNAAAVIQALSEARDKGIPYLSKRELESKIGAPSGRLWDSFRAGDGPKIKKLITATSKGFYKLNLSQ
jgi:hypothetical protein